MSSSMYYPVDVLTAGIEQMLDEAERISMVLSVVDGVFQSARLRSSSYLEVLRYVVEQRAKEKQADIAVVWASEDNSERWGLLFLPDGTFFDVVFFYAQEEAYFACLRDPEDLTDADFEIPPVHMIHTIHGKLQELVDGVLEKFPFLEPEFHLFFEAARRKADKLLATGRQIAEVKSLSKP